MCPVSLIKEVGESMSHDIIDISCAVSPGYSITDFNITLTSVKDQVEQSLKTIWILNHTHYYTQSTNETRNY